MATQPVNPQLRKTGIGVVGDVPWGAHFFMFYETKQDLLDTLVPYFKAGLETGELCLWSVSDPLTVEEARNALRDAVPEFKRYLAHRSIEIVSGRRLYYSGNDKNFQRAIRTWDEKTDSALTRGYAGFRLSASTAWLERQHWKAFSEYEDEVNDFISRRRMTALCTYPLAGSTAAEILDVIRTHQFAIARRNRGWEMVETSELKQAKSEINRLNDALERRVMERTAQLTTINEELRKEIANRQRAEEELHEAQADLARISRALAMGELVASIAHEVNQPLSGVVMNSNFVLRQLASKVPKLKEVQEAVTEVVEDANRVNAVISRVRSLLQKATPDRVELDINEVVQQVSVLLRNETAKNRVQVRLHLAAGLPRVLGDRVQLQQVLINLVMNAISAMRTVTDRTPYLDIKSAKHADSVLVRVQDSGIGLDPDRVKRIFEPFYTTKPQGIGIGLSISRSIIESHGGRLWTEPTSFGAIFQFTLPTDNAGVS